MRTLPVTEGNDSCFLQAGSPLRPAVEPRPPSIRARKRQALDFQKVRGMKPSHWFRHSATKSDEQVGHHTKFDSGSSFICLEQKAAESYPSKNNAVLFFEVPDLKSAIATIGLDQVVQPEGAWAVLHDPEGHNVILVQRSVAQPK